MSFGTLYRKMFAKSTTSFPGGFIPSHYIVEGVGADTDLAIVVGDLIGRDYGVLKEHFTDVKALDIVDNGVIPNRDLLLQDASKPTNIDGGTVDYVVICNVLEHMYGDMECLLEMNRILKGNGRLFIDTPYFSDSPFFHYRIYSPLIFRRMLDKAGFKVVESSYRGVAVGVNNYVFAALAIMLYPVFRTRGAKVANQMFLAINKMFSCSYIVNRRSKHFGEYLVCEKVGEPADELQVQKQHFGQRDESQMKLAG
jgi:SAM-dependent methyltransferase